LGNGFYFRHGVGGTARQAAVFHGRDIGQVVAHKNNFAQDGEPAYFLVHESIGTLDTAAIIARLGLKKVVLDELPFRDALNAFNAEIALALRQNYNVITDFMHFSLSIRGTIGEEDFGHILPSSRIELNIAVTPGKLLHEALSNLSVTVREQSAPVGPVIQRVYDPLTGADCRLTRGEMACLAGHRLAVVGNRTDEIGVYFTAKAGESPLTLRVGPERLSPNTSGELCFVVPQTITEGEYWVKVSTQGSTNRTVLVKDVRSYTFSQPVTVV